MRSPGGGPLRVIRTAVLAVACTGLAWGGHAVWAGSPIAPGAFAAATALMAVLLVRFTRCQRGFCEIFTVLAAAQVGLHLVFQGLSAASPTAAGEHSAHPAPGHGSAPLTHALGVVGFSPGMLAGHLWAALLAAALLAHGERCLWTLLRLLTAALPPLLPPAVLPIADPRTGAPDPTPARPSPRMLRRERTRGPPSPAERLQLRIDALHARPHTI
ncbi:hypothetical protein CDO52_05660 [Nocardiopsis gilva YIM 90087]|uniref:Uncharacterized protein n=1 Tax=Nocardiopsis gilva YIM 90087 TaxID=1235441 RepID=A0A223S2I6_9ACTN|nr:hypothetical protein [Nocardiopsis gilva]ASU82342.1 hypothetical protein CDO52_05660 [Nocardiopsis gilva YIM 90087]